MAMLAYVLVEVEVTDPVRYEEYKSMAPGSIHRHGGRYLVRGGPVETLEGEWPLKRVVILEFPDAAAARAWWSSADYRPARDLRQHTTRTRMVLLEGIAAPPSIA